MKILILILIITLSQVTISLSQTPTDIVNWKDPNAYILDTLVFQKIKEYQSDMFYRKYNMHYELSHLATVYNSSVLYYNNTSFSDMLNGLDFIYFSYIYKYWDYEEKQWKYNDSTFIDKDSLYPKVFNYVLMYGRTKDDSKLSSVVIDSQYNVKANKENYINPTNYLYYQDPNTLKYLPTSFKMIVQDFYLTSLKEPWDLTTDNDNSRNINVIRINHITNINNIENITYYEISNIISDELLKLKQINNRIDGDIGISVDFDYHNHNRLITTIVIVK